MRLWHKDLIDVLPRQQLLGQWRECCLIAKNIANKGTPNHILVNRIMDYPLCHFWNYGMSVMFEMQKRGYKVNVSSFTKYISPENVQALDNKEIFNGWHDTKYLWQCYRNLEEKHDCGGISDDEWFKFAYKVYELIKTFTSTAFVSD